ncbi:Asp-tRNA(Asn)/Glu-tRNA(Gln) amidotransferase subunit GatA [Acetilactobacillus jinshanensis]|uniref:Glutamyl-tRNA(Gln) amidotransferase subunit A n=1 Tax=Acetilactobacillus jinshanensis TaxID=1720083 RepID=A0A4P6ZKT0_9LACO|nr:Asp-tRNA(Asn)/Glu-tRNA(Gln) amidotransferase subunit GatA [Acetilactobacillus jinshanensis]QBP17860.1 Asp-tRNA(Asn)/Glu-tRNA(Gln) amidotransferase subunit GatA [Acetilactobacillus jinshanensis]URL60722.1 Asp-tRNA(Asn)/Glu-tRNA(Gln) amidotransferase subunit GatA [uncultured bacterium]
MNFLNQSLTSVHQKLVNGDISAEDLTRQTLANIKKTEPALKAFITVNADKAIKRAQAVDKKGIDPKNLLSGIPVAIKDLILTKGVKTTAASKMLYNFNPIFDATVIKKLKKAGTIDVGKTNLDEFAMGGSTENSAFQKTHNAWNHKKVPGGSSGGSAVAVASGDVLAALGTDTGGSIRQPAAFNGIVGMKPTYGRVSRWGIIAFASSMDQVGPMTRNVFDNAVMLNAIAGHDVHDLTSSDKKVPDFTAHIKDGVKGLRIAVPKEYMAKGIDPAVRDAVENAIKVYKKLGAKVDMVSLPHTKYGVSAYYILSSSEASSNLERYDGIRYGYSAPDAKNLEQLYIKSRSEGFGDEVKRRIMLGTFCLSAGYVDAYFKKAAKVRTLIIDDFKKVYQNHDVILAPTSTTPAYDLGSEISDPIKMYMNDVLTVPVNLAGLPSMSIPDGFTKDSLPIGMQLIGRPFDEQTVYRTGYAFEQNTDFHKRVPKMGGNK